MSADDDEIGAEFTRGLYDRRSGHAGDDEAASARRSLGEAKLPALELGPRRFVLLLEERSHL
jgi:hypothetical protein